MVLIVAMSALFAIFVAGMTWWRTEQERGRIKRKADQLEAKINAELAEQNQKAR